MSNNRSIKIFLVLITTSCLFIFSMSGRDARFDNCTWNLWPDKVNVEFQEDNKASDEGRGAGRFTIPDTSVNFLIYRHLEIKENKNYKVSFSYKLKDMQTSGNSQSQVIFDFNKKNGGNGSAGSLKFTWDIGNKQDSWQTFSTEARTTPEAAGCQLIITASKIKGIIWISDFKVEEIKDVFPVYKTKAAPEIDGKLGDECWKNAVPLTNFYCPDKNAVPARIATKAYFAYDDNNFYIAFKNDEPEMNKIRSKVTERDGNLWEDDCDEIFIAAPNGNTYQFIVNSINTQWDGKVFVKVPGDPYTVDTKWNGTWTCAASKEKDSWTTELCIPVSNFQTNIKDGGKWSINLARERKVNPELSHFNRVEDNFNNVAKFATLDFAEDSAKLTRCNETIIAEPLKVTRTSPKFKELLSEKPGNYATGVWASECVFQHYPATLKAKYTTESFAQEQENILSEYGQAGVTGPAFPWLPVYVTGGMELVKKLHEMYKLKYWFALSSSGQDKEAVSRGAKYVSNTSVDPTDPEYQKVIEDYIKSYFSRNKDVLPYIAFILAKDEPMNQTFEAYSVTFNKKNKDALIKLDEKIKKEFGFGKFGLYDTYANNNDPDAPFKMISFMKWWNNTFMENSKIQKALADEYAPGIPFIACNMNCVQGIGKEDVSVLSLYTDYVSADPYPTSSFYCFGRSRALYHTGFSFKLMKDLSGNKPETGFVQAFPYAGRTPSPSDLREWASQALKNGADAFNWFCVLTDNTPLRVALPDVYKELLRLSNIIHRMNKIEIPRETKTAIFFSNPSFLANFDEAAHSSYTVYSILGENLKTWFRFVSDSGLRLKLDTLSNYSLVYVPQVNYCDPATAETLLEYVKNGGRLVILDPEAFTWNVDGTRLDKIRNEFIGCMPGKAISVKNIVASADYCGLKKGDELPLTPIANRTGRGSILAFEITPSADAKVIAAYPDGKPAAFERKIGKGTVVYFAAQPFGNSDLAIKNSNWSVFMKGMAEQIGEKSGLPIWDFELPATGGEIAVKYVIKPDTK